MLIKLRRDTAANWTAANPILSSGEPGVETDTGKLKIGNGSTSWNTLPYISGMAIADDTSAYQQFGPADTLKIAGANGISTALANGTLTITGQGSSAVPHVYYVAKNGSDSNNGTTLATAWASVKHAMSVVSSGDTVLVSSGVYTENNPITIPAGVNLIGDSLRGANINPANPSSDMFYLNNGSYVFSFTFNNYLANCFSFNPNGSAGMITRSPYVLNCTSLTTTGTFITIDGNKVSGGKSMIVGQCTVVNQGGVGMVIKNRAYSQIVALYTICCDVGISMESGSLASMNSSDSTFGNYGIKSDGTYDIEISGTVIGQNVVEGWVEVSGLPTPPSVNNVALFAGDPNYYTIDTLSNIGGDQWRIYFLETLPVQQGGTGVAFYVRSLITASAHTFEYVGTGISLATARPQSGAIPIPANNVVETNGGRVNYTSTDEKGNFNIGPDIVFNRATGTISGRTFNRALFSTLTPYMLALEGSNNNNS
jgi:hypothetical protein